MLKFSKFLEKWEYYHPSSFWVCTISGYLCFTTLFTHLLSFSTNPYQAQVIGEKVRGGGQEEHEVINSVDNLAKKNILKKCKLNTSLIFDSRASLEK